jgi:hypothetical protein
MYCASYGLGDVDVQQVALELDVSKMKAEENRTYLLELLMRFLEQSKNSSASIRLQSHNGKYTATMRLASSADESELVSQFQQLLGHALVARGIDTRVEFDSLFSDDTLNILSVPNSVYEASGVKLVTDYVILPQLDELCNLLYLGNVNFIYQVTLALPVSLHESLRFVKKSVVRLEERLGVPKNLVKKQNIIANRLQKCEWLAEEYFAVSNPSDSRQITDMVQQYFEQEHSKFGFPALTLESSLDIDDEFLTGLHSRVFEPLTAIDEASQLVSTASLTNVLKVELPVERSSDPLPSSISCSGAWDVFLSHCSKDAVITQAICHYLESKGVRCWMAPRNISSGEIWSSEIMNGIKKTKVTMLLLSEPANNSRYVLREIEQSVSLGHAILPVRLQDIMPSDSLNFFVSSHHWFDAVNGELENHLPKLYEGILPHLK